MLLATTTAQHAYNSHNDTVPTVTDVRMALTDCGVLLPVDSAAEEQWRETMRKPIEAMKESVPQGRGGIARARAEKRKREEEDVKDVAEFKRWFDSAQHTEIRRVAGMVPDATVGVGGMPAVGVGGGVVQAEDFLTVLKKKNAKGGDESRWFGTVLGSKQTVDEEAEAKEVLVEGGPVQRVRDWRPRLEEFPVSTQPQSTAGEEDSPMSKASSTSSITELGDAPVSAHSPERMEAD
jgi:transcription initiation factor TFIID subunit 3